MSKELYLMRHGQTRFNALGKVQGACDSPLTENGISQAKAARNYLEKQGLFFEDTYCSTQERASDTLEIIIGEDQPYTRLKGLKEWDFGEFEGEREALQPKRLEGETSFGPVFIPFGGESNKEVAKRMNESLTSVMENSPAEQVLVVSHAGAIFLFLQEWMPFSEVQKVGFSNCVILHLEYDNGDFKFIDWANPLE